MADMNQITHDGNGVDRVAPLTGDWWGHHPDQRRRQRISRPGASANNMRHALKRPPTDEYSQLWRRYYEALRVLRDAFGKRTLGSDQTIVNRGGRVVEAMDVLKHVCPRLDAIERGWIATQMKA